MEPIERRVRDRRGGRRPAAGAGGAELPGKPGDPVLGAALRTRTSSELLALVTGADADGEALLAGDAEDVVLQRAVPRWRDRIGEIPSTAGLAGWQDGGLRLVVLARTHSSSASSAPPLPSTIDPR